VMMTLINQTTTVNLVSGPDIRIRQNEWGDFLRSLPAGPIGADPRWLLALADGLGHIPYCLEAWRDRRLVGLLPLSLVHGPLFGRFLVSLPYVSTCGPLAIDCSTAASLVGRAVALADELRVKHLQLRVEQPIGHACFEPSAAQKVLMRRPLPTTVEALWKELESRVRNHIRQGEKHGFSVQWGGQELLDRFYKVFSRNMRDLGTPVFGKRFFASIFRHFPAAAEICVIGFQGQSVAAALLLHGRGITEVPSSSVLREFRSTNANMFLYWHLLQRAVGRGQDIFDFGRSTKGCGTERFKAHWGAEPSPAVWECYYRRRKRSELRKESRSFALLARVWRCLPLRVAEFIGPPIVCGIP
jgi:serine/alanine adding enzyme